MNRPENATTRYQSYGKLRWVHCSTSAPSNPDVLLRLIMTESRTGNVEDVLLSTPDVVELARMLPGTTSLRVGRRWATGDHGTRGRWKRRFGR